MFSVLSFLPWLLIHLLYLCNSLNVPTHITELTELLFPSHLGLLNLNGPYGDQPLLYIGDANSSGEEEVEDIINADDEEERPRVEDGSEEALHSISIEDHIFENLPPHLHRGNLAGPKIISLLRSMEKCMCIPQGS